MSCQVQVAQGRLQGKECNAIYGKKYYSFEGIPYAKPPVGRLRFRPPQEPEPWTGIRDATKPGNKCSQINPYSLSAIQGSEDCLYLNVYTPSLPQEKNEKLPVLFFVHGGRFLLGYGDYYKPDYFIKHDVIIVTVNYRLNVLGFLSLGIPEVPGNAGLKDTIMALRWVRDNIEKFNGDKNNVTVFGESAGAAAVCSYLTSKMAEGLFHKLIAQSGNAISNVFMVEHDPVEAARTLVSNLGKELTDPRSIYEFLCEVPIEDLIPAFAMAEISRPPAILYPFFMPVIEKKFDGVERYLEEYPRIDVALNRYKKVPILTGINSHEGALFVQRDTQGNIILDEDFFYLIPNYTKIKRGDKRIDEIEEKIRQFYFNDREINDKMKLEYVNLLSDAVFNFEIMLLSEIASKSNDVFYYKFEYSGNINTKVMKSLGLKGATHGDMIQYQFYRNNKHDRCFEKDLKVIEFLAEAWCNFARHGKPTWDGNDTKWLPYTKKDKHTLLIGEDIKLVKNPDVDRLKFWLSVTGENSKL